MPSYETTEWIAGDGTVTNLMDIPRVGIQPGRTGAFMPPVRVSEDVIPFRHGSRIRDISFDTREIDLPLYVSGLDETDLRARMRALLLKFNPLDADGRLRFTRPDGSRREIFCRYTNGMQLVEDNGRTGPTFAKAVATFRCNDPLFYDVQAQSNSFGSGTPQSFFPGTPFRLSSGTIFNAGTDIVNDGDFETWPIWIINGPGNHIALKNLDTNEKLEFLPDFELVPGESLIIDTRENKRTVIRATLLNLPIISNVFVSNLTANSATINWTTNIPATSQIEYGTTLGVYPSSTTLDPTLAFIHAVSISGLSENVFYYYRIRSTGDELAPADSGTSEYKKIVRGSAMWPLYKGANRVSVDMQGTSTDSLVSLNFYRRYLSV